MTGPDTVYLRGNFLKCTAEPLASNAQPSSRLEWHNFTTAEALTPPQYSFTSRGPEGVTGVGLVVVGATSVVVEGLLSSPP